MVNNEKAGGHRIIGMLFNKNLGHLRPNFKYPRFSLLILRRLAIGIGCNFLDFHLFSTLRYNAIVF